MIFLVQFYYSRVLAEVAEVAEVHVQAREQTHQQNALRS